MTLEFNVDDHNNMLIAFVNGQYEFDKIIKVINMTLERCVEKGLTRALIDMAKVIDPDVPSLKKYVFGNEMHSKWDNKLKMCIVYDHKYIPEIQNEEKADTGGWAMITSNQNKSVFWLLSN